MPKLKYGIFGLFMGAQLCPDSRQQNRKLERFGHIIIGPGIQPQNRIGIAVIGRQHQDRAFHPLLAHLLAQLAPVRIRQADIKNKQIKKRCLDLFDGFMAVASFEYLEILGRAQLLGQRIGSRADMLEAADGYLLGLVSAWQGRTAPGTGDNIEMALILWSLSERGLAPTEALDKLHGVRTRLPVFSRAMLTMAIAKQKPGDARLPALLNELKATVDEREAVAKVETDGNIWTWYWDSDVRSSAVVLMAMLAVDPEHPLVSKLTRGLLESRRGGRWANTQENAFSLVALAEYAAVYEADEPDFQGRVWLANEPVVSVDVQGRDFAFQDGFAPMPALLKAINGAPDKTGGGDRLILERAGTGRMYYRVGLEWASTATDLPAKAEGVAISRRLRSEQGVVAGGEAVNSGQLLAIDIELQTRANLDYMAIEVPLPAGLEAIDVELGKGSAAMTISGYRAGWVSHQELRRDRAVIFADRLPEGTHTTTVFVRATTPGDYVMPAASAELMYYPEIYGRTTGGRLVVH